MPEFNFSPGVVTRNAAQTLTDLAREVEILRRTVQDMTGEPLDHFPAKVTAVKLAAAGSGSGAGTSSELSLARFSWAERTFDRYGKRIDLPLGRTGSADYMPAFAVGTGKIPNNTVFPFDVWLRRRLIASDTDGTDLGPVFEFDWQSAGSEDQTAFVKCLSGTAGGEGGGIGSIASNCCNTPIPTTLYLGIDEVNTSDPACTCLVSAIGSGIQLNLVEAQSTPGHPWYEGTFTVGCGGQSSTWKATFVCATSGGSGFSLSFTCLSANSGDCGNPCGFTSTDPHQMSTTCPEFDANNDGKPDGVFKVLTNWFYGNEAGCECASEFGTARYRMKVTGDASGVGSGAGSGSGAHTPDCLYPAVKMRQLDCPCNWPSGEQSIWLRMANDEKPQKNRNYLARKAEDTWDGLDIYDSFCCDGGTPCPTGSGGGGPPITVNCCPGGPADVPSTLMVHIDQIGGVENCGCSGLTFPLTLFTQGSDVIWTGVVDKSAYCSNIDPTYKFLHLTLIYYSNGVPADWESGCFSISYSFCDTRERPQGLEWYAHCCPEDTYHGQLSPQSCDPFLLVDDWHNETPSANHTCQICNGQFRTTITA